MSALVRMAWIGLFAKRERTGGSPLMVGSRPWRSCLMVSEGRLRRCWWMWVMLLPGFRLRVVARIRPTPRWCRVRPIWRIVRRVRFRRTPSSGAVLAAVLLGKLQQRVSELWVFDAGALPHLGVHRDRGESGHRVDFVDDQFAVVGVEEIHA